jgi:hypothetical protein
VTVLLLLNRPVLLDSYLLLAFKCWITFMLRKILKTVPSAGAPIRTHSSAAFSVQLNLSEGTEWPPALALHTIAVPVSTKEEQRRLLCSVKTVT